MDIGKIVHNGDEEAAYRAAAHFLGLAIRSPLPMKAYDLSNAARNAENASDVFRMGLGYRK
jgi:hypothetical protein